MKNVRRCHVNIEELYYRQRMTLLWCAACHWYLHVICVSVWVGLGPPPGSGSYIARPGEPSPWRHNPYGDQIGPLSNCDIMTSIDIRTRPLHLKLVCLYAKIFIGGRLKDHFKMHVYTSVSCACESTSRHLSEYCVHQDYSDVKIGELYSPSAGGAEHQSSRMVYVFRRRYSCHSMESVRKIKVD